MSLLKGLYVHMKTARLYKVLHVAVKESNPLKRVVVYEQIHESFCGRFPKGTVWTRDLEEFTSDSVTNNGIPCKRFEYVEQIFRTES